MIPRFIPWTAASWISISMVASGSVIHGQVPDKNYLMQNHFPLNAKVEVSALEMPSGFSIEENGYFFEQSEITNMGYWAWKKIAELVPYDYNPE